MEQTTNNIRLIEIFDNVYQKFNDIVPTSSRSEHINIFNEEHYDTIATNHNISTDNAIGIANGVELKIEELYNNFINTGEKDECLNDCFFLE